MKHWIWSLLIITTSCYTFQGISIPADVDTFYVETFEDVSGEAPPEFNVNFSEDLMRKIRDNSRLQVDQRDPDLYFSGSITQFTVRAEDPNNQVGTALNRLYVRIEVKKFNTVTEEEEVLKYEEIGEFGAEQDFFEVQDAILEDVTERLLERIFNDSFTNW
ncbi:MAG: LPS assembly lipoprotein LptE [Saprospiraceae bacterium]|nr:LPS assembly lipoprotein LptE [Saprospiraceae bacterium]